MNGRCNATRLYLVRHGEVDHAGAFYGQLDVELSERGLRQAETVAAALAPLAIDAVYSSDLARAAAGAHLIAASHRLEVEADAAFREMSLGVLEGHPRDAPHEHHPDRLGKSYSDMVDFAFPGGENFRQVAARVVPALERLLAGHAHRTVALVAHNSVNRIVIGRALGVPLEQVFGFSQSFGCVNCIDFCQPDLDGGACVRLLNWTAEGPVSSSRRPVTGDTAKPSAT